jgi:cytochrome c1
MSHYSEVAAPLANLTKKSHMWAWTDKCQDAFEKLKHLLTEVPLLRTPDESTTCRVVTDASDIGLGGVLLQEEHPIAYESRKLNSAEQNYTTTEREMLAVVHALRVWRCYLEGVYFEVETDHKCNTFFQSQPNLSRRQARWSEFLQRFGKFKWDYCPGEQNVADALSRRDEATSSEDSVSVVSALAVYAAAVLSGMYDRSSKPGQAERLDRDQSCALTLTFDLPSSLLKSLQLESQVLCKQIRRDANRPSKSPRLCVNSQGLVVKDSQAGVPDHCDHLKWDIMETLHDTPSARHYGIAKTCKAIQKLFFWTSMREDVARYVTNCVSCARNKARRHAPYVRLQTIPVPEKPWYSVSMDLIIKLPVTARGHDSICVFVDRLTKMVHFVPCKEKLSAKGFAELYVDNVFRYDGLSKEFISDRDSRFTSEFWKGVTELLGTRLCVSSSFHLKTNGQTERVNQTLEAYLRHFVSATSNDWDLLLSRAESAHNNALHESIQATPFYLNHGRHPRTPMGGKRDDNVLADSAAFVKRLQSTLTLACKLLIAAQ